MPDLFKQRVTALSIALAIFLLILHLLRRRRLREEYSWLWFVTGAGIVVVAIWYDVLQWVTSLIGAVLPTSALFFLGLIFVILICLQFSVKLSALSNQIKNLTQEMALLRAEMEGDESRGGNPGC